MAAGFEVVVDHEIKSYLSGKSSNSHQHLARQLANSTAPLRGPQLALTAHVTIAGSSGLRKRIPKIRKLAHVERNFALACLITKFLLVGKDRK